MRYKVSDASDGSQMISNLWFQRCLSFLTSNELRR